MSRHLALLAALTACSSGGDGRVASGAEVERACGSCHAAPDPSLLSQDDWVIALGHMRGVIAARTGKPIAEQEMLSIGAYYHRNAPARLPALPAVPATSPVRFEAAPLGRAAPPVDENGPAVLNLSVADLGGRTGVLVCEDLVRGVSWIDGGHERTLALTNTPARAVPYDHDGDGDTDVLLAILGELLPTEKPVGGVVVLDNHGDEGFVARTLLSGVGRVTDARPGDLDGDGDLDIAVASFGFINAGGVGWLERTGEHHFEYRSVRAVPGAIHVPVLDLDGDGDLDLVALVAQDTESVLAFLNDGAGHFTERVLFAAGHPAFGATGLDAVDLDRDGDIDFVVTNGDAFDERGFGPRPYHGVRWLENRGDLDFASHEIVAWHGAYASTTADLDGDGDLDIAAVSMFNDWSDAARHSLIWLENDGRQQFTPHGIATAPIHLVTIAAGDLDGDGRVDLVAGGIHGLAPPDERKARVTVWWNRGTGTGDGN